MPLYSGGLSSAFSDIIFVLSRWSFSSSISSALIAHRLRVLHLALRPSVSGRPTSFAYGVTSKCDESSSYQCCTGSTHNLKDNP